MIKKNCRRIISAIMIRIQYDFYMYLYNNMIVEANPYSEYHKFIYLTVIWGGGGAYKMEDQNKRREDPATRTLIKPEVR